MHASGYHFNGGRHPGGAPGHHIPRVASRNSWQHPHAALIHPVAVRMQVPHGIPHGALYGVPHGLLHVAPGRQAMHAPTVHSGSLSVDTPPAHFAKTSPAGQVASLQCDLTSSVLRSLSLSDWLISVTSS